jgi:pimeloyl-ACP methyl ester carboxylesterase
MGALHAAGFHVVAIDLRGYGLSDVPERQEDYTCMHYVGDVVGLLDALSLHQVFLVGHDWGALVGWDVCLLRPDRVKGYVAVSVPYNPRLADNSLLRSFTEHFGEGFYMNQFQIPGKFEAEVAEAGISKTLQVLVTTDNVTPEMLTKPFDISKQAKVGKLPHWFTEDDLKYYTEQFEISGFTGPLNYYRNIERSWELKAPWTNVLVHTPTLFIAGKRDLVMCFPGMEQYIKSGEMKHVLPNLHDTVFLDGAHFIHEENPEEFNAAVIKFLKALS